MLASLGGLQKDVNHKSRMPHMAKGKEHTHAVILPAANIDMPETLVRIIDPLLDMKELPGDDLRKLTRWLAPMRGTTGEELRKYLSSTDFYVDFLVEIVHVHEIMHDFCYEFGIPENYGRDGRKAWWVFEGLAQWSVLWVQRQLGNEQWAGIHELLYRWMYRTGRKQKGNVSPIQYENYAWFHGSLLEMFCQLEERFGEDYGPAVFNQLLKKMQGRDFLDDWEVVDIFSNMAGQDLSQWFNIKWQITSQKPSRGGALRPPSEKLGFYVYSKNREEQMLKPLTVHPNNPRYFTNGSGKAVYLTGSHTWNNLQHNEVYPSVDYDKYLDFLQEYNHNFIRMWAWEQAAWDPWSASKVSVEPIPYQRTGAGTALDGKPKFDITQFNQVYFDRLRTRVAAAQKRGIYVSVMLFEGWSVERKGQVGNPWQGHPFNKANNINGIDADLNNDGEGKEIHTLKVPQEITNLQKSYVKKVNDTLNDFNNVLWEIGNEHHPESVEWQYHIIEFIHEYEKGRPKQHPVGMTAAPIENDALFNSPADWISPTGGDGYKVDPPAADGSKVIIADVDHIWPREFQKWVWKSFTRGLNTAFMDLYGATKIGDKEIETDLKWVGNWIGETEAVRKSMGYTLKFANRMNLAAMAPKNELSSTRYCLANVGCEYLIYQPESGSFTVNLEGFPQKAFSVEWFNPDTGDSTSGTAINGGVSITLHPPFNSSAVLYLKKKA